MYMHFDGGTVTWWLCGRSRIKNGICNSARGFALASSELGCQLGCQCLTRARWAWITPPSSSWRHCHPPLGRHWVTLEFTTSRGETVLHWPRSCPQSTCSTTRRWLLYQDNVMLCEAARSPGRLSSQGWWANVGKEFCFSRWTGTSGSPAPVNSGLPASWVAVLCSHSLAQHDPKRPFYTCFPWVLAVGWIVPPREICWSPDSRYLWTWPY